MAWHPRTAMVLCAGLGKRMLPLTRDLPKPMVPLAGRPLIDHVLDNLAAMGVEHAVVNVHYLADRLTEHLRSRRHPRISISDERTRLLETGGGVRLALPLLGDEPFYICNADSISLAAGGRNYERLAALWDEDAMDSLMLLAPAATAIGYDGPGDFAMDAGGHIRRRREREIVPFVFTGTSIAHRRLFAGAPEGAFSLNLLWDRAIAAGRIHGMRQDGLWMHVGTPEALQEAERAIENGEAYF